MFVKSFTALVFSLLLLVAAVSAHAIARDGDSAVLVELFTSEGCPNCPPADRLLEEMGRNWSAAGTDIVAIAYHVDYWDREDWRDLYSSPVFSRRQDIYAYRFRTKGVFTPMMVFDGEAYLGGSKENQARKLVERSLSNEKAAIEMDMDGDFLKVKISGIPKTDGRSTVYLAVAEDGLSGNGRRNKPHYSVVRRLSSLGILEAGQEDFAGSKFLQFDGEWKKDNLRLVVFVQENGSRKVIGVGKIELDGDYQRESNSEKLSRQSSP